MLLVQKESGSLKKFKVEYVGPIPYEFDTGEIAEALEVRNDPDNKWFRITDEDGEAYEIE